MLRNLSLHFQTQNPLLAILPSCRKPTEDPFLEESDQLDVSHQIEFQSTAQNPILNA